ncbi:carbohydrate-binding protein [Hymenobacter swuensis]|uniref:Glycoside hydrolase family protein n=1 Tax=Hymenobacter swuensis DY53 TaxID=1227739 RepID=W8F1N9_9BACT|nr:family 16 glycosylhydrolase [Hymenobacter swuensis]AHJ96481.1 glycoside hydrolase family protein [Hymenobacter swuensis DY53]
MKHSFTSLLGAAALCVLGSFSSQAQTYQQVWADEFTSGISPSWVFETGGGGWGNNEKQYYQRANATVANGILQITARKENVGGYPYTSSRMKTQGTKEFRYGKIEARMKLPLGQGLWPAFWMLGSNINTVSWPACGEIDVMEHINAENKVYGTVHWDNNGHAEYGGNIVTTPQDYHVYTIEWEPAYIRWFVDGVKFHEINISNNAGGTEEFQRPFFLLLNLAVAGNWPGQTVDESKLPATMYVDYVRVYQKTTAATSKTIQAESYSAMNGVQLETTTDAGGGQNVAYVDAGDWMAYNSVNFPTSGNYLLEYRVASPSGGTLSSDLNAGAVQLGNMAIPATGGWQNWTTVSRTVYVNAGTYNFGVFAQTGGWNLNWIRITPAGSARAASTTAAPAQTEALDVAVFPNPQIAGAPLTIQLQNHDQTQPATVQILDVSGKQVWQNTVFGSYLEVDRSLRLTSGIYLIQVTTATSKSTKKLVVQ